MSLTPAVVLIEGSGGPPAQPHIDEDEGELRAGEAEKHRQHKPHAAERRHVLEEEVHAHAACAVKKKMLIKKPL
jgi:hypothetical protein